MTQVVAAGAFYGADRMVVACSRPPGPAIMEEKADKVREYPRSRRSLRPYQEEAVAGFREALVSQWAGPGCPRDRAWEDGCHG